MSLDADIWRIAVVLTKKYGADGLAYAERRGEAALQQGDQVSWQIWQWIREAVKELLKPAPEGDEKVH